jgi:gluconolactonase
MKFAAFLLPAVLCAQPYVLGPDSQVKPGVPKGKVTKYSWSTSKVFPGTTRDYWVYVPAQYDGTKPACVLVLQDGGGFATEAGAWRLPTVLDNLIQEGAMPVTIAILIDPGVLPASRAEQMARYNRSYEYDGLGDHYARFLIDEILPEVGKQYKLSSDPNDRAIGGSSSGGIAAFNAAWERPDAFRRVLSFIGSYTNLRGGDHFPNLIRKMEPKPIRVFLQDGSSDLNIYSGSWWMANQSMAMALEYAGYEVKFTPGTEAHNSKQGSAILPDALRWLWNGYPKPIAADHGRDVERHYITEILDPASDWKLVSEGYQETAGLAVDRGGNVFFCDPLASRIFRVDAATGKVSLFKDQTGGANSLMFGPDGRLFANDAGRKRVVAYSADGAKVTVIAAGIQADDLAVTSKGDLYFTDSHTRTVSHMPAGGKARVVFDGHRDGNLVAPVGVRLTPDEALLVVGDSHGRTAWSFRIEADGGLSNGEPFYHLELPDAVSEGPVRTEAAGITFDTLGNPYIATSLGIQICDQPGRVNGIIRRPGPGEMTSVVFGGADLKTIYAAVGGRIYARTLRRTGVFPWVAVKLPKPQL